MPAARFVGRVALVLAGATTLANSAFAQDSRTLLGRWEDSSAAKVVAQYRSDPTKMVWLLRQVDTPQSRQKLDEIADSLTRQAITFGRSTRGLNLAVRALIDAGAKSLPSEKGTPLPGVLDRLIHIDRELQATNSSRVATLFLMLRLPEHTRAVEYLLSVVTSPTVASVTALGTMIDELTPGQMSFPASSAADIAETRTALKALWDRYSAEPLPPPTNPPVIYEFGFPSRVIPNDDARVSLEHYARLNNWGGGRKH